MLETGYCIGRVFPLYGIRFISVSDNYDSAERDGGAGGMELAFKFLIHEQYGKDLSAKVKSARRAKALRGEYISKNCAYGYKKVIAPRSNSLGAGMEEGAAGCRASTVNLL
jgi:DNA invertase Pin-like site-specific DNA recombinase